MLFALLHEKLIARVRDRIRSGEITERGLAKLTGLSQPHVHNVLKGARSLSTESADLICSHLGISLSTLADAAPLQRPAQLLPGSLTDAASHLSGAAGPFHNVDTQSAPIGFYPLPPLSGNRVNDSVWVTLSHDPEIFPYFQDGDVVLVARDLGMIAALDPNSVYLVKTQSGTLLRALRLAGPRLYLVTPRTVGEPRLWTQIPLAGRDLQEIVFGKLIWLNRELRPNPFGFPQPTA